MQRRLLAACLVSGALGLCAPAAALAAPTDAPTGLTANTDELQWNQVDSSTSYVLATSNADPFSRRTTTYSTIDPSCTAGVCTYDPPAKTAGTTWWYGVRNNVTDAAWADGEVSILWPTAPAVSLSTSGIRTTLSWSQVGDYDTYVVAVSDGSSTTPGRHTRYDWVPDACSAGVCTYDPPTNPGKTEWFGARVADVAGTSPWPAEVSHTWAQHFGINSANGLGATTLDDAADNGISYAREELDYPSSDPTAYDTEFSTYLSHGLSIEPLLNTDDDTPLSSLDTTDFADWAVAEMERYGSGGSFWDGKTAAQQAYAPDEFEIVNEPFLKGHTTSLPDPAAYAHLWMATYDAAKAEHLTIDNGGRLRLGFAVTGDYETARRDVHGNPIWSQVANDGGWLHDAIAAEPGLVAAINAAGAIVTHPYGTMWSSSDETWTNYNEGWGRIDLFHSMATAEGITAPEWVTEAGYQVGCTDNTNCVADEATQSANVDQMVADVRARPFIARFDYFNMVDYPGWSGGLFQTSGTAREAWSTYTYDITH